MPAAAATALSFDELCALEPALGTLAEWIGMIRLNEAKLPVFCANERWYGPFGSRAEVQRLVGWASDHPDPRMHTQEAYNVAYQTLYHMLPDCRGCGCLMPADINDVVPSAEEN